MKRIFSILFVAVFVFQSLSGLYVLAAFYLNRAYISKNLCENRFDAVQTCAGKCFLVKELKQKEQQQEKLPDLKQKEINLYCEETILQASLSNENGTELTFVTWDNHYSGTHLSSIFHPPCIA